MVSPTVAQLKDVKLLQKFTESELAELIQVGQTGGYEAHSNIVIEGEMSWGLFLILQGVVGIFKTNKLTGDICDIGSLRAGSFFGEMSLIDNNPRSATVKALGDCQVFYISKEAFMSFLDRSPDLKFRFYENCIRDLIGRLRELGDSYVVSQYQLWKTAIRKEAS